MNCLSCRNLLTSDLEHGRVFRCGHDSMSVLDTNEPAELIYEVSWNSEHVCDFTPTWCPYKFVPVQLELTPTLDQREQGASLCDNRRTFGP